MLPATALAARAATRRLTVLSRHVCTTPAAAAAASGDGGDKSKPKAPRNMSLAARKTVWVVRIALASSYSLPTSRSPH